MNPPKPIASADFAKRQKSSAEVDIFPPAVKRKPFVKLNSVFDGALEANHHVAAIGTVGWDEKGCVQKGTGPGENSQTFVDGKPGACGTVRKNMARRDHDIGSIHEQLLGLGKVAGIGKEIVIEKNNKI